MKVIPSLMVESQINYFTRLNAINVSKQIEKKAGFAYLSWPFAVAQLRMSDPTATWEICRFNGLPFLATDAGVFVEVAVTVQGITLSQIHPVLDGRNRSILAPTSFDINTSIQRCLVKAIALHGLGLYIYAGEDLPQASAANDTAFTAPVLPTPNNPIHIRTQESNLVEKAGITKAQQAQIRKLINEVGATQERVLEYFGVSDLGKIPANEYTRVIRSLENKRAA